MRKLKLLLIIPIFIIGLLSFNACQAPKLESGGAYAPTNSVGQVVIAPDIAFYQTDAAFSLAYGAVQAVLKFELDNRDYLWGLSPQIKKTLDGVRPDIQKAVTEYFVARDAYKANPTPAGLSLLQTITAKAQQLATAAQAVTSNLQSKGN